MSGYILRSSVAALLFSCIVVALSSAINLSNHPPNFPVPQNNTASGANGHGSAAPAATSAIRKIASLTFADRVAYQRAIEDVYWRHRIWPRARPDPKPPLDEVVPSAQLEKKVADYLSKSQVLEDYWQRPLTAEQLQAEMDRMAQQTRQPEVLRELFEALGNDPFVIAECLARPLLSERLVTNFYAHDQEPLESGRAGAENHTPKAMAAAGGNYRLPTISDWPNGCTNDTWAATSTTNAPSARAGHTAVWTGSEMIVWGGSDRSNYFNTGGRYNPGTDSWTATSTINAPSARAGHTAVWTGIEMIVWGGATENTGGRYNPGTDSWTATSTINAPSARWGGHTAVWTGIEMIVWGGISDSTGGRYNPGTDSWTATSTTNAPTPRGGHRAVWTGSEMIVWGGNGSGTFLNTGGRYDPNSDSWTATSTTNAPSGRSSHTAVWTGSEMIVWGGTYGSISDFFNTGGRYNPSTDSWIATSCCWIAPAGRERHTAVWSDSEMIVWGGDNGIKGSSFNTGGRYNPGTNSWTATSTTNAPEGRNSHTAVWSGSEMIVWGGGHLLHTILNTGGRYFAQSGPPLTPTPSPTASPTPTPTPTPTTTATATSTATPTITPRSTPTPRSSPTPRPRPLSQ